MAQWKRGEADVEALIAAGDLQKLTGEAANGERLLKKAVVTLGTARLSIESDPDSAFVLAYDAARQALTALLAHQGLRPTTKGGHYTVEQAAQRTGIPGATRRRRHDRGSDRGRQRRPSDHHRGRRPTRPTWTVLTLEGQLARGMSKDLTRHRKVIRPSAVGVPRSSASRYR